MSMEMYPGTDYAPDYRWYDQVDVPVIYQDMSRQARAQYLANLASWTVELAAQHDERRIPGHPLLGQLGYNALAGTENMAFQASLGAEDAILRTIGAR
jgi:hypothetical protein